MPLRDPGSKPPRHPSRVRDDVIVLVVLPIQNHKMISTLCKSKKTKHDVIPRLDAESRTARKNITVS
jgi:hypothetical protein